MSKSKSFRFTEEDVEKFNRAKEILKLNSDIDVIRFLLTMNMLNEAGIEFLKDVTELE